MSAAKILVEIAAFTSQDKLPIIYHWQSMYITNYHVDTNVDENSLYFMLWFNRFLCESTKK